ncbi:MAG: hypothetical protein WD810_07825 [Solirubrobacterales bacterium]
MSHKLVGGSQRYGEGGCCDPGRLDPSFGRGSKAAIAFPAENPGNGSVDRSFGNEGTLITNFGIEPPQIGPNRYKAASVGLRSPVVDSQGRPVLTGGSVSEVVGCYEIERAVSTASSPA